MKTIKEELECSTLSDEYSYLQKEPSFLERTVKKIFEIYCKLLFKFYCPLTVKGRENIPDESFIFCSNHNSHMDSGILMVASGKAFKDFAMMAAKDYFFDNKKRKNFLGLLMNLIPINRNSNRKEMIAYLTAIREFTKRGKKGLIIYPEGTRSRDGKIQAFKKGPALASIELGLPIVPAHISGTHIAWPKGRVFMKPTKIEVHVGKPIYPKIFLNGGGTKDPHFSVYNKLTEELENNVRMLNNGVS